MNFFFKIGVPSWKEAANWGDFHFASAICAELGKRGHGCKIQVLNEWKSDQDRLSDVTIHLKGLSKYSPKKGCLNAIWIISHPDKITKRELKKYDLILVASQFFARNLKAYTDVPVFPLLQFADVNCMYPEFDCQYACDLLFLGNSRRVKRKILSDLLPSGHDLHVWGSDWESIIPQSYVKGRYFPYRYARKLYSSAKIVLNDHWPDMKNNGFFNNRIFDALACNALVISDRCAGMEDFFQGGVVAYTERSELKNKIDFFLNNHEERKNIAAVGFEKVVPNHSIANRVDELLFLLKQLNRIDK